MIPFDFNFCPDKFPSFRLDQLSTAQDIATDSQSTCVLRAPPGRGKTLIYMTVAQLMHSRLPHARTLILTQTRQLQDRLVLDFASVGLVDVRGASNYSCSFVNGQSCASASEQCDRKHSGCTHHDAIIRARESRLVVTNYAFHLYRSLTDVAHLGKFNLIVCDEAHLALNWLTDVVSFHIADSTFRRLINLSIPSVTDIPSLRAWDSAARQLLLVAHAEARLDSDNELLQEITRLGQSLRRFLDTSVDWVVEQSTKGTQHSHSLHLRPIWPGRFAYLLFGDAAKVILCSATISDADPIRLGRRHFSTFALPSNFAAHRRPVIYVDKEPHVRVDRKTTDAHMRILCDRIAAFAESTTHKGIIQSPSYALTQKIKTSMREKSRLLIATKDDSQLDKFASAGSWILVSPSLKEGVDFPYDTCAWVAFPKVPFPYFGDALLRARCNTDSNYSDELTTRTFVQMALRASRASDDYCMIVVFDAHYAWWKLKAKFEPWFEEACETVSQVPTLPEGVFSDGNCNTDNL